MRTWMERCNWLLTMMKRTFTYLSTLTYWHCYHGDHSYNRGGSLWLVRASERGFCILSWISTGNWYTANVFNLLIIWWFSRVWEAWKEDRLSQEILDISKLGQFIPLWCYFGPELPAGWSGSEHWMKLVSVQLSHLNICWRRTWSCSLVRCLKHKTSLHLNAFDDKLFEAWVGLHHCLVSPRTVNTASWTTIHFPEVNCQLMKTVRSSSLLV